MISSDSPLQQEAYESRKFEHQVLSADLPEYRARRLWCTSMAERRISPLSKVTPIGITKARVQFRVPLILLVVVRECRATKTKLLAGCLCACDQ